MEKFSLWRLQIEQQMKTNELVDSQYRNDPCENGWVQSLCVISYVDFHYSGLAALLVEDLTHVDEFYRQVAIEHLEKYYFTLV